MIRTSDGRWVRWRLPADFVAPSPTEPNLASSVEAARAVQAALRALAAPNGGFRDAVIALPDRAAHAGLSEGSGSRAVRRLRSDLVRGLATTSAPSSGELDGRFRFGTLASGSLGRRSVLGAVTGSPVARQYEAAAEAAGLRVRWVDATSLALLPEWLGRAAGKSDRRLLLLLHRRHFVLVTATAVRLTGFRMKLRAALDPDPPALAIRRATESGRHAVSILGDGAAAVADLVRSMGLAPVEARDTVDDGETPAVSPVTDGALAALLRRAGERPAPLHPAPVAISDA